MKLRPNKRHVVKVTFDLNEPVELGYLKTFITDALETWGGQFHPDDELFGSLEKVRVSLVREKE